LSSREPVMIGVEEGERFLTSTARFGLLADEGPASFGPRRDGPGERGLPETCRSIFALSISSFRENRASIGRLHLAGRWRLERTSEMTKGHNTGTHTSGFCAVHPGVFTPLRSSSCCERRCGERTSLGDKCDPDAI
jgi:hypothetical protein